MKNLLPVNMIHSDIKLIKKNHKILWTCPPIRFHSKNFIIPTKKLKSHSAISKSEGVKKQLPISNFIEDRLKANANVVEEFSSKGWKVEKSSKPNLL